MKCTYQLLVPLSLLGQWVGKGGDLTKQVIKYPTIWAVQVIKSPPDPCS